MADAEPDRIPLLQIVHVSDLHVGDDYDDKQGIAADERAFRRVARQVLEDEDIGGWREGTLTSDTTAIPALDKFLDDLRKSDTEWFNKPGEGAQTWLLDTGDLTTFGDEGSLSLALQRLEGWRARLEPCASRILYGNHDAWPGTQPVLKRGDGWDELMRRQRDILESAKLDAAHWLNPLVVENKAADVRIELHGLDSVLFDWNPNARALGAIDDGMLDELLKRIRERKDKRTYRILAVHHPVAYPYLESETKSAGLGKSVMTNAKQAAQRLGKKDSAYGKIPIHLILSGHTHGTHPAGQLPHTVKEIRQGPLKPGQLQLVVGPLMLIRDVLGSTDEAEPRKIKGYSDSSIRDTTRQLQVLRFHFDERYRDGLVLERFIAVYEPGFTSKLSTARTYVALTETISESVVLF